MDRRFDKRAGTAGCPGKLVLVGALAPRTTTHHAAITVPVKVGALLRAIDGYDGQVTTGAALKLAPCVFVRSGELRAAEWSEMMLDCDEPQWRIPADDGEYVVERARPAS